MTKRRRLLVSKSSQNSGNRGMFLALVFLGALNVRSSREVQLGLWNFQTGGALDKYYVEVICKTATAIFLGGILFLLNSGSSPSKDDNVAVVTIYPALGVQLSSSNNRKRSGRNQLFLPRDKIVDCIVYEVILSHKVVNVVAFRILPNGSICGDGTKAKDLELIPAFPGTDMTYQECFYMRREILKWLGLAG